MSGLERIIRQVEQRQRKKEALAEASGGPPRVRFYPCKPGQEHYALLSVQARQQWPEIERLHGMNCHWCGISLVFIGEAHRMRNTKVDFNTGEVLIMNQPEDRWEVKYYATVEHLVPVRSGGDSHIDNLRPACKPCNTWREDADPTRFILRARRHYARTRTEAAFIRMEDRERRSNFQERLPAIGVARGELLILPSDPALRSPGDVDCSREKRRGGPQDGILQIQRRHDQVVDLEVS